MTIANTPWLHYLVIANARKLLMHWLPQRAPGALFHFFLNNALLGCFFSFCTGSLYVSQLKYKKHIPEWKMNLTEFYVRGLTQKRDYFILYVNIYSQYLLLFSLKLIKFKTGVRGILYTFKFLSQKVHWEKKEPMADGGAPFPPQGLFWLDVFRWAIFLLHWETFR